MKRMAAFCLGFLFFGAFAIGAGEAGKDDLKRLQGKWQFVERIVNGKKMAPKGTWTISGNEFFYDDPETDGRVVFTLGATSKPKTFDFDYVSKNPKQAEKGFKGIYEIDGDTFKICVTIGAGAKERPTAFESKEGSGVILTVLKRVKEKK